MVNLAITVRLIGKPVVPDEHRISAMFEFTSTGLQSNCSFDDLI